MKTNTNALAHQETMKDCLILYFFITDNFSGWEDL